MKRKKQKRENKTTKKPQQLPTNKNKKHSQKTQQRNIKTNKHAQKIKLKHFFGIFAPWRERQSSKPKGASGFEVNIAPEHMKTPMQKSTMPRLLEENYYLWGTIARKVFFFLYSPVLTEFCWQLLLSLSP